MPMTNSELLHRAVELHRSAIVIDTHCDTTQKLLDDDWDFTTRHSTGHVDLPRLRDGGVSGVFFAVWCNPTGRSCGRDTALRQFDRLHRLEKECAGDVLLARTTGDVRRAKRDGKVALLIGVEGGHQIENSLETLREFHQRGAVYMTLTHAAHTDWADSAGVYAPLEPMHGGLTDFGREVVREMNRLGMMVDVSHASDDTFRDVLDTSSRPVIATHSNCRALCDHRRNISDDMITAMCSQGGLLHINFAAPFLDPDFPMPNPRDAAERMTSGDLSTAPKLQYRTPLRVLVEHFEHALKLVGSEHVGLGSDFDGVAYLPQGIEDCARLPALTAALLGRGHGEHDLRMLLGENVLRLMDVCQRG